MAVLFCVLLVALAGRRKGLSAFCGLMLSGLAALACSSVGLVLAFVVIVCASAVGASMGYGGMGLLPLGQVLAGLAGLVLALRELVRRHFAPTGWVVALGGLTVCLVIAVLYLRSTPLGRVYSLIEDLPEVVTAPAGR
ncbi:MAG: hypothetical protein Q8S33_12160 [Myxococcales bacterium]|nr:hypothetical protein [Myxococcales bacterium]MDP3501087.1 hypothetical protein [Myxococcales bacterium]